MGASRFDRFLPFAGVLAGLLFFVGLFLNRSDPSSETGPAETFAYWHADRGQHQIVGLLVAPLIAFLLLFFGAGLKRRLETGSGGSGHGSVAFGGALLAAAVFALVGMLEAGMTNAAHEGERQAVYTLNSSTRTIGSAGTPPSPPCCSQPASAPAATRCCPPRSRGRR